MPNYCSVCPKETDTGCSACKAVLFCSRRCQKLVRLPFTELLDEKEGRSLFCELEQIWKSHKFVCKGDVHMLEQPALTRAEWELCAEKFRLSKEESAKYIKIYESLGEEGWNQYVLQCVDDRCRNLLMLNKLFNRVVQPGESNAHRTLRDIRSRILAVYKFERATSPDLSGIESEPRMRDTIYFYFIAVTEYRLSGVLKRRNTSGLESCKCCWMPGEEEKFRLALNRVLRQALIYWTLFIQSEIKDCPRCTHLDLAMARLKEQVAKYTADHETQRLIMDILFDKPISV